MIFDGKMNNSQFFLIDIFRQKQTRHNYTAYQNRITFQIVPGHTPTPHGKQSESEKK